MLNKIMQENIEICCICLGKCAFLQCINKTGADNVKHIEKLKKCLPNDKWNVSFRICKDCEEKLDLSYTFIQLCLKSANYRMEQLKFVLLNNTKENIIESDFTCFECNKTFRLKRALGLHITRIHKNHMKHSKGEFSTRDNSDNVPQKLEESKDQNLVDIEKMDENKDLENFLKQEVKSANNYYEDPINRLEHSSSEEELSIKGKKLYRKKISQKCQYCGLEFSRTDKYVFHVRTKHALEKPFKCDLCESKYLSQHNLNIHMRKHRNEKPFVCSTCGKCFTSSNDLWQHNKIHDQIRQYPCDECNRSFKTHSNLRTHKLQMHQDPALWKFICTVCGKKFPMKNNLVKHLRRHEGIKDFLCHLCDKKFVAKIDLQSHLLSHSDERLFKCSLCCKEYKKKDTLRRHMKIIHNLGNFAVKKPEKKLNCPMCPKMFAFNNKLQRHILIHTGEKPYQCTCCDKKFRDNYEKNTHLRQVHNIEPKSTAMVFF